MTNVIERNIKSHMKDVILDTLNNCEDLVKLFVLRELLEK